MWIIVAIPCVVDPCAEIRALTHYAAGICAVRADVFFGVGPAEISGCAECVTNFVKNDAFYSGESVAIIKPRVAVNAVCDETTMS